VWSASVFRLWAKAARGAAGRRKLPYMALSLRGGGVYLVAGGELAGRAWSLEASEPKDVIVTLVGWRDPQPTHTNWGGWWKVGAEARRREPPLFRADVGSMRSLKAKLHKAGVDISAEFVDGDPIEVASRLEVVFAGETGGETIRIKGWSPKQEE